MTQQPSRMKAAETHWARRKFKAMAVVFVLLIGLYGSYRFSMGWRVRAEIRLISAEAHPTQLSQLPNWYQAPAGPNAASIYRKAFNALVSDKALEHTVPYFSQTQLPRRGQPLPSNMAAAIDQYLNANATALQLLHEAAGVETCWYGGEVTPKLGTERWELMSKAWHLLALQAILAAHRGMPDNMGDSLVALLRLTASMRHEPLIQSCMVRASMDLQTVQLLERVLGDGRLKPAKLDDLSQLIADSLNHKTLARAFIVERCLVINSFDDYFFDISRRSARNRIKVGIRRLSGLIDLDKVAAMRLLGNVIEEIQGTDEPRLHNVWSILRNQSRLHMATRLVGGRVAEAMEGTAVYTAIKRCALTGLAMKRYQLDNDAMPRSLTVLVPKYLDAVPTDPYDDRTLQYVRTENHLMVYSVGPDGIDNGGVEQDSTGHRYTRHTDVTFTLTR